MIVEHNQSTYNGGQYDNAYKFNGKELDDATGMYYYGARYYDPRISIFVSVDPLAEQTMEPYLYTGNNPIRYVDPTGMSKDDWVYNKSEETYHWDERVSGSSDIKDDNYEYVGRGLNDVREHYKENHPIKDFFNINPTFGENFTSYGGEFEKMGEIRVKAMKFENWRSQGNTLAHVGVELTYGTVDNVYIFATGAFGQARGLSGQMYSGDHASNRALDGFTTLASLGFSTTTKSSTEFIKSSPKLWNGFQKRFSISNVGATRAQTSQAYREFIRINNESFFGNQIFTRFERADRATRTSGAIYDAYNKKD